MPVGDNKASPEWETNQPTSAANQRTDDSPRRYRARARGGSSFETVRRSGEQVAEGVQ